MNPSGPKRKLPRIERRLEPAQKEQSVDAVRWRKPEPWQTSSHKLEKGLAWASEKSFRSSMCSVSRSVAVTAIVSASSSAEMFSAAREPSLLWISVPMERPESCARFQ